MKHVVLTSRRYRSMICVSDKNIASGFSNPPIKILGNLKQTSFTFNNSIVMGDRYHCISYGFIYLLASQSTHIPLTLSAIL